MIEKIKELLNKYDKYYNKSDETIEIKQNYPFKKLCGGALKELP